MLFVCVELCRLFSERETHRVLGAVSVGRTSRQTQSGDVVPLFRICVTFFGFSAARCDRTGLSYVRGLACLYPVSSAVRSHIVHVNKQRKDACADVQSARIGVDAGVAGRLSIYVSHTQKTLTSRRQGAENEPTHDTIYCVCTKKEQIVKRA